jgi:hypothetical protein
MPKDLPLGPGMMALGLPPDGVEPDFDTIQRARRR